MKLTCLIFILLLSAANSARILAWFATPAVSHQNAFQSIWKKLSLRGHEVTAITPEPLRDPSLKNLTEIDMKCTYAIWKNIDISHMRREVVTSFEMEYGFHKVTELALEIAFKTREIQEIMGKPKNYFDLILIESGHPVLYGLQHKFHAPLIGISSMGSYNFMHHMFGNPIHPYLYPDFVSELFGKLTLWERIDSIYLLLGSYFMNKMIVYPHADKVARSYFGDDMPYIEDMVRNASLQFENINPIFADKKPLAPNFMQYSNFEKIESNPLPMDLQTILDDAKDGAVYFSLGTNVRFDHLQGNVKEIILEALGELPYVVLCKWESEDFPGKPKNVILKKWFPQKAVLAHPNVKVFVMQGGLQSAEEAIPNAVPLVIIPFLCDQPMNAKILTLHGMAETILPQSLKKEILRDTILKVISDGKYRSKAQEIRSIFLDQPQLGIDKIIWWCEYVIRHKGAKHLRSPSADISLYEYFMLDVFALIFVALFAIYQIVRLILRIINNKFNEGKKKKIH